MKSYREDQLYAVLEAAGIQKGDAVLVHTALFRLGAMKGAEFRDIPTRVYRQLRRRIGAAGTVVVPTFNFGFCRGDTFDRQHTPAKNMGVFSEYVRRRPDALRSAHPMQSVAATGPHAQWLTDRDTPGAYDENSSFDALLDLDAHILMVGCSVEAISLVHWAEQRVGVPYRFWKDFAGRYRDGDRIERRSYRLYARDLNLDPQVVIEPAGKILRRRGELRRFRLGAGAVQACRARDFAAASLQLLRRDPNALVRFPRQEDQRRSHAIQ